MSEKLLKELVNAKGISGDEREVRKIIKREIAPYVDSIKIDRLGNLIAHRKGTKPRVMLAAHMDEIGLMIKSIDKKGRINFSPIGGITPITVFGQTVHIQTDKGFIKGIVTTQDINDGIEISEIKDIIDMFIDTGLTKKELVKKGVVAGSYIDFEAGLGCYCKEEVLFGKALDDRIGCYILIELAKKLKNTKTEIFFAFTVQEELGLYGSKTSAHQIDPDWGIAVDVMETEEFSETPTKMLGEGPCITAKDAELIGNRCIDGWLKKIAKKNKIPIQIDVSDSGTTDALSIALSHSGVPATVVGVAVRNIHTRYEMASMKDIKNAIKLLHLLMKKPPKHCIV